MWMFAKKRGKESDPIPKSLDSLPPAARTLIVENLQHISDDALIKLVRQVDFWMGQKLSDDDMMKLVERLVDTATWRVKFPDFKVPKVRFGKTELQIPIITCGGMRFQHTWMPDMIPIAISAEKVVKTPSQENAMNIIRACLKVGINHFETARLYGTSEIQLMEALGTLVDIGEIKRSDFILQTKLRVFKNREDLEKEFERSWKIFSRLEYIDMLSFWCVSSNDQTEWTLADGEDSIYQAALDWQKQGKVKHIGFSTHGTAENIMKLINSERFSYVNIHYHYFGSYHASGTSDTVGGEGNAAAVKRALELDMGVFNISPVDKGGKLYEPSEVVARTIGPELNPISFALLQLWKQSGMHTASVGFARPADLDEAIEAARLYSQKDGQPIQLMEKAVQRLDELRVTRLGAEWSSKGLLGLPDCYDESTQLTIPGHLLWLHDCLSAYGMYSFAKERYDHPEKIKYNRKKSFEENAKALPGGNLGRCYVEGHDYSTALQQHYDPALAAKKLKETHDWLTKSTQFDQAALREKGWQPAYTLLTWDEYPNMLKLSTTGVVLQNVTRGMLGCGGGPTEQSKATADAYRQRFAAEPSQAGN